MGQWYGDFVWSAETLQALQDRSIVNALLDSIPTPSLWRRILIRLHNG